MSIFARVDIIHRISYTFKDKKLEMKSTNLRMNMSTHPTSLKKIHLFSQSLVEGHFLFCLLFSLSFIS